MAKGREDGMSQLNLGVYSVTAPDAQVAVVESRTAIVSPFVDAATLAVRRDAIRRLESSGIFSRLIDQVK
jgi:hypothetical protein